jgi:hypothetical protein
LLDAVTRVLRESPTPPEQATAALVDVTFWIASAEDRIENGALAQTIASRAFTNAWDPAFRKV